MGRCAHCGKKAGFAQTICLDCTARVIAPVSLLAPESGPTAQRRDEDLELRRALPMTTTADLAQHRVVRVVGVVSTERVLPAHDRQDVVGLAAQLRVAREACFDTIRNDAKSRGGNAVVAVRVHYTEIGDLRAPGLVVGVVGTAVVVERART